MAISVLYTTVDCMVPIAAHRLQPAPLHLVHLRTVFKHVYPPSHDISLAWGLPEGVNDNTAVRLRPSYGATQGRRPRG